MRHRSRCRHRHRHRRMRKNEAVRAIEWLLLTQPLRTNCMHVAQCSPYFDFSFVRSFVLSLIGFISFCHLFVARGQTEKQQHGGEVYHKRCIPHRGVMVHPFGRFALLHISCALCVRVCVCLSLCLITCDRGLSAHDFSLLISYMLHAIILQWILFFLLLFIYLFIYYIWI